MPLCTDLTWYESLNAGSDDYKGTPSVCCSIPIGTVGARNHSVVINGQKDDCSTNPMLCAFPKSWPIDRRERKVTAEEFQAMLQDGAGGGPPLFSCGRKDETLAGQNYGNVGELCLEVNDGVEHAVCEDQGCTKPQALAGFFRLDLDMEFACQAGSNVPCQNDVDVSVYDNVKSEVAGSGGSEGSGGGAGSGGGSGDLCVAPAFVEGNKLANQSGAVVTCGEGTNQCSNTGSNAVSPGACVFRRPKEARRALGDNYLPWSAKDVPTQNNVKGLTPRCDKRRFEHLLDPSIYDKYPGLQQSPTCYDLVACNPKSSCTGNNQCGLEYQWMRPTCVLWQEQNPNRNNCTSDDQCRQRSGSKEGKAQGVFEQVYLNRCICKRT